KTAAIDGDGEVGFVISVEVPDRNAVCEAEPIQGIVGGRLEGAIAVADENAVSHIGEGGNVRISVAVEISYDCLQSTPCKRWKRIKDRRLKRAVSFSKNDGHAGGSAGHNV